MCQAFLLEPLSKTWPLEVRHFVLAAEVGLQTSQPARLDFFSENLFYHEVTVSKYPLFDYPPYELALSSKLVDVMMYEKLDILHVHYAIPHA